MVDTLTNDSLDFDRFHREELPARLAAGNGALAVDDARLIGPLAIRTPAGAYTYVAGTDTIEIVEGDETAKTVISLDAPSWEGLVRDLDTPPGLLYGGRCETVRGNPLRFVRWEPALRAMFHGRPVYDAELVDLHGLDPAATFTMDDVADHAEEMRDFFDTCGYVLRSQRVHARRDPRASSKTPRCWPTKHAKATRSRGGDATPRVRRCCAGCCARLRVRACARCTTTRACWRWPRSRRRGSPRGARASPTA